ncbi:hypothetical protein H2203_003670 [Taxawa tesnikishii (nom. ined.)]|nr:hypothetical protein H2203_003670 [Dothideales sp. JES 119]
MGDVDEYETAETGEMDEASQKWRCWSARKEYSAHHHRDHASQSGEKIRNNVLQHQPLLNQHASQLFHSLAIPHQHRRSCSQQCPLAVQSRSATYRARPAQLLGALVSKTGRKLSDTLTRKGKDRDVLADDEEDYERQKVKEEKKEQRKADYERLGLEDKVKWGSKGGMSMS